MWNEIRDENDIEKLMWEYGGFHDSCIVSISYQAGAKVDENGVMSYGGLNEYTLDMVLYSQWKGPVELHFEGVRKCSIVGWQDNFFCDIFGAYLGFSTDLLGQTRDDRLIVWADHNIFKPMEYSEEEIISPSGRNCTYVISEKLFWKMAKQRNA